MKDFKKIKEKGVIDCDKQKLPIHLLELFGGIGAPRRALENVIFQMTKDENPGATKRELRKLSSERIKSIDYVEVLPYAVQAYNQMFDLSNRPQDIRLWNLNVDILVHGSPCQDFSREGKNDINTGRSILYERTLQILDPHPESGFPELTRQPKVVIWENVPNMAYSHPEILAHYLQTMESYGYTNTFCGSKKYVEKGGYVSPRSIMVDHMLNASDYGIPQARERFFCISVLNELADKRGAFVMPKPISEEQRFTLKQFLDLTADMDAKENQFTDTELSITKKVGNQWYVKQAVKGDFGAGVGYIPVNEYQRIDLAFPNSKNRRGRVGDYASTLTTSPRQGVLIGDKFRTFTAKEKLRLMGFRDDDYEKMVKAGLTDKQISHLAGNSICVPVLEHIFDAAFRQYPELAQTITGTISEKPDEISEEKAGKKDIRSLAKEMLADINAISDNDASRGTGYYVLGRYPLNEDTSLQAVVNLCRYKDESDGHKYFGLYSFGEVAGEIGKAITSYEWTYTKDCSLSSLEKALQEVSDALSRDELEKAHEAVA